MTAYEYKLLRSIDIQRSTSHTPRNSKHRLQQVSVVIFLALLNATASAFEEISVPAVAPEFYPQSLVISPQPFQIDLRYVPEQQAWDTETGYKLDMKFKTHDAAQPLGGALRGFAFPGKYGERNDVEDLRINLSVFDNWVQLSVRQSESFYAADTDYLRSLLSKNRNRNWPGSERFLSWGGGDAAHGTAALERLDVNVFRSDWLGASVFASHSDVDADFLSLTSEKTKDEFAIANRSSNAGGVKVSLGPLSLKTSYTVSTGLTGIALPEEERHDRVVAFDFTEVRKRWGEFWPSTVWDLAPSGIYVGNYSKVTSYESFGERGPDRTTGVTAGAYWIWNGGNANVSYWNYHLESPEMGDASYDSSGHGLDANVSFYGAKFQYYGGFSYYQTEDLAPLSRAVDHGFYAYSSVTYKPATAFPDIIVDGGLGQYGYRGLHNANYDGTYWSAALGMDFSKFLWDSADSKRAALGKTALAGLPSLKVFYRYASESYDLSSETHLDDHLFGIMLRVGPAQSVLPRLGRIQGKS